MSQAYHAADENEGFEINEPIDVGDLSDQSTGQDVIEAARHVPFVVKAASVKTQLEDNKAPQSEYNNWKVKRLKLQVAVGALGTDGEGRYANKVFFPELILTMNTTDFPDQYASDWWKKKARGPFREFLTALGYDIKQPPVINDEFLSGLMGAEFRADIRRVERRQKNSDTQKYEGTGEMENTIENFRAIE